MTYKSASLKNPRLQHPDEISKDPWNNYNQEVYQNLQFNNAQLPDIDKWEVGNEYELLIKVKMDKRVDSSQNEIVGDFKILQVKPYENAYEEMLTENQRRIKKIMV